MPRRPAPTDTTSKRRALFVFPTDVMGGAERVLRMVAEAALASGRFDEIVCFVLCKPDTGTLTALVADSRARVIHSGAGSEKTGLPALLRVMMRGRYAFVMSTHTHLNAATSLARRIGLLTTDRLVTRESTMIFERKLTGRGRVARHLYAAYGGQDLLVCQSERMAVSLAANTNARFADRTVTLPNPIHLAAIASAPVVPKPERGPGPHIVWCGRLSAVKSPLRAVDTLAAYRALGHADATLTMIGDGDMRDAIHAHAASLGLGDALHLTGRVEQPASLMRHADAGLLTSDIEGFPNVLLEMLAAGVPSVVTTDCAGGLADVPGIAVAPQKTAASLAHMLHTALPADATVIAQALEDRSPARFLDALLVA